jgi:hypothetical protein
MKKVGDNIKLFDIMGKVHTITCQIKKVDYNSTLKKSKKNELKDARFITMSIIRAIYKKQYSYADIASFFCQDHATAIHGIKKSLQDYDSNKYYRQDYKEIYFRVCSFLDIKIGGYKHLTSSQIIHRLKGMVYSERDANIIIATEKMLDELSLRV